MATDTADVAVASVTSIAVPTSHRKGEITKQFRVAMKRLQLLCICCHVNALAN